MQQPLRSPLLYLMQSVGLWKHGYRLARSPYQKAKIFFPFWNQRIGSGTLWACVHSTPDALDNSSTAIGCYMHRPHSSAGNFSSPSFSQVSKNSFPGAERNKNEFCCWQKNQVWLWLDVRDNGYENSSHTDPYSVMYMLLLTALGQIAPFHPSISSTTVAFVSW